jgi:multiple sugar transport system permease protein
MRGSPAQPGLLTRRPAFTAWRWPRSPALRRSLVGYAFLSPWLVGLVGLTLGPTLASLYLSLTKFDLLSPPRFVGLGNYTDLLTDARYWQSVRVTFTYVLTEVPIKLGAALLVALLLNRSLRGISLYRAAFYVPSLLGGSVAIAILWRSIFGSEGIVNDGLMLLGWADPPPWLVDPRTALYTLVLLGVWQFGSPMLIFLAGLRQIPRELYEAAAIDGAGRLASFWRITLPMLSPVIFFNLVLQMIGTFQTFTPAYIVSNGQGGPVDATLFYALYLYQQGFARLHMGYAAAMAWVLLLAIAAITFVTFRSARYWVFYSDRAA